MSKVKKTSIVIAIVFIVSGFALSFTAFAMMGFDYKKFETEKYEMKETKPEGSFSKIIVDSSVEVKFAASVDGTTRVSYPVFEDAPHDIRVEDDTLKIMVKRGDWHWTTMFIPHISFGSAKMTIYLPKDQYESLVIESNSGDVLVPENFTFGDMTVKTTSGDVISRAQVTGAQSIKTTSGNIVDKNAKVKTLVLNATSGDIRLEAANVTETLAIKTFSGNVVLENVKGGANLTVDRTSGDLHINDAEFADAAVESTSGDSTLKNMNVSSLSVKAASGEIWIGTVQMDGDAMIKTSSGDIVLRKFDAANLTIQASSGDVSAELLSNKNYTVHTSSGSSRYPDDGGNGFCKVTTSSGDVRITVVK
ncbi:MAG: DUF4097 family beta strand repeat protein [Lachnospiraceae bacterium]|nr:DUF4097 family beta strand repeat protein [Lachnospiraceae bacterium]